MISKSSNIVIANVHSGLIHFGKATLTGVMQMFEHLKSANCVTRRVH